MRAALAQALFTEPDILLLVRVLKFCSACVSYVSSEVAIARSCSCDSKLPTKPLHLPLLVARLATSSGYAFELGRPCMQDEPTNHLDLPSILWLQGYLKTLEDRTIVVVSHDRAFLDEVAQEIILLRHNRLAYHTGEHSSPPTSPYKHGLGIMKSILLPSVLLSSCR